MARYIGMFDLVRDGTVNPQPGEVTALEQERADHLKAAGYYFDATMMAVGKLPPTAILAEPIRNPTVKAIAEELAQSQPKSFAAGMDMILADVMESARTVHGPIDSHSDVVLILVEYPRDPRPGEPGCDWIAGTQAQRAALLAAQTAVLLSTYLRMLGHAGAGPQRHLFRRRPGQAGRGLRPGPCGRLQPVCRQRYGLAAVSTTFAMAPDQPLAPRAMTRTAGSRTDRPGGWARAR